MKIKDDIIINPGESTTTSLGTTLSVKSFGAVGNGIANDQQAIQNAIDYCIANGISSLFLPKGTYKINSPLLLSFTYLGSYAGCALRIYGESNMWDSKTIIQANFSDRFIIGIQRGKGASITGIHVKGLFTAPSGDDYAFFNRSFADFTDGTTRDSRYSPHCGIAIDPFSNSSGDIPSDGGYPGMTAYYKGAGGAGGSTSTFISDCIIENVVVGICSSPNGFTRNTELSKYENIQFKYNKLCISGGHDQEKANVVRNIACWYDSHTIFATGYYGAGTAGNWYFDTMNLAGRVCRVVDTQQSGYFPSSFTRIYGENIGVFGSISNSFEVAAKVENCIIDFAYPNIQGIRTLISGSGNVIYQSCTFRYYGSSVPLLLSGNFSLDNCSLSSFPVFITSDYNYPRFINCRAGSAQLGLVGIKTFLGDAKIHPYGQWTLSDYGSPSNIQLGETSGFHNMISSAGQEVYTTFQQDTAISVTVSARSFSFTSTNVAAYKINGLVSMGIYYGYVSTIVGNTVTVVATGDMTSGTYSITAYHPIYFYGIFIGDITSGSNTITNCKSRTLWGYLPDLTGYVFKNPYGGTKYLRITSVSGTTITFYGSVTTTKTGAIFGNYTKQEIYTDYASVNAFPAGHIVRKGDEIIEQKSTENEVKHKVTAGGFLSGDTDTRQATLTTIP